MHGEIFKVTESNPRLAMEINGLLAAEGLEKRNAPGGDLFAGFGSSGHLIGVAGGRQFETDCHLRFVAVSEDYRNEGTGSSLVSRFLSYYSGKCERAYTLATKNGEGFMERFGFEEIPSDRIPGEIRDSTDLREVEIAAATPMLLNLPKKWPII